MTGYSECSTCGHKVCTGRGRIYREFPSMRLSWWRADCQCGWSDMDITEWHYARDSLIRHLGGVA